MFPKLSDFYHFFRRRIEGVFTKHPDFTAN